jgi:hypothetical protein
MAHRDNLKICAERRASYAYVIYAWSVLRQVQQAMSYVRHFLRMRCQRPGKLI